MKLSIAILFCWMIILVSGEEQNVSLQPEPLPSDIPTTTGAPNTTTTVKPTDKPTTTKAPTTPPTTTTATTTTTTKPPITLSTTTTKPTTTLAPTTPKPAPAPKQGKWILNQKNKTCIIVSMAAQFDVTYVNTENKTVSRLITLPNDNRTAATGNCGDSEQDINILWPSEGDVQDQLTLHFIKNGTKDYSLHHIELALSMVDLPKINSNETVVLTHDANEYHAGLSNSYRCAKLQSVHLNSTLANTTGTLKVSDFQFQAFRTDSSTTFGYAEDCAVETQDIVPIAVGCALIVLIIIVLVAYLVGRRRSQARGYRSM